jgi:hypothetical protein
VSLVGSRENAALIAALHDREVWLCSPVVCRDALRGGDPAAVLRVLWQPEGPARLPGLWRRPAAADFAAYALTAAVVAGAPPGPGLDALLAAHPAWPALSFVAGREGLVDREAAAGLLARIVEPRWYGHPYRPHRLNRLNAYLGLGPENAGAVLGVGPPGRHFDRARLAFRTWYNPAGLEAYGACRCGAPECFLWRVFARPRTRLKGLLRATERLVGLVARVWVDATGSAHPEARFAPELFFEPAECRAFAAHIAGRDEGAEPCAS